MTKCLVNFDSSEKCQILTHHKQELEPMQKRRRVTTGRKRSKKIGVGKRSRVKIIQGKVVLKVRGFTGLKYIPASQIVKLMPLSKIRSAAKKLLGKPPKRKKDKRSRKSRNTNK